MSKGFTILETLFGIAIIAIAVTIVTISFSKINSSQALEKSTDLAISIINEARSLTLSSKDASQYGVNVEDSQLVLFKGSAFSSSDPENISTPLNQLVGIRNINLNGGGASIIFNRLTGATNQTGTFELYLKDDSNASTTVSISATGIAETR